MSSFLSIPSCGLTPCLLPARSAAASPSHDVLALQQSRGGGSAAGLPSLLWAQSCCPGGTQNISALWHSRAGPGQVPTLPKLCEIPVQVMTKQQSQARFGPAPGEISTSSPIFAFPQDKEVTTHSVNPTPHPPARQSISQSCESRGGF